MKIFYILALLLPTLVVAAPVAIETSAIGSVNKDGRFGIGATLSIAQRPFIGVDNQTTSLPYISYQSGDFFIEGVNVGYTSAHSRNYKVDLLFTPRFYEVNQSFAPGGELNGIEKTNQTLFAGVSAQYNFKPATVTAQVVKDLLESDGFEIVANVSKGFAVSKAVTLIPSAGFTWQSDDLVDYFYGVQASEVQAGRPLYKGQSTFNYNASLTASWQLSHNIELLGFVKYELIGDGITQSSIVDEDTILLSAVGAVYRF